MSKVSVMLTKKDKRHKELAHTYEGDYDVALVGTSIVVTENLAVLDKQGNQETEIRTIYNSRAWNMVSCT